MDPSVSNALSAAFAGLIQSQLAEQTQAIARQRDASQLDNRGMTAGVFRLIAQASDPSTYADLQTASHVPTAQPFVVPNFVTPTGATVGTGS